MDTATKDELYGLEGDEQLSVDIESIVERVLDDACEVVGEDFNTICDRIKWPVKIMVFRRMKPSNGMKTTLASIVLNEILYRLDEEYGDPEKDIRAAPTKAMSEAAKVFVKAVAEQFYVWQCESTGAVIEITRELMQQILARWHWKMKSGRPNPEDLPFWK